MLRKGEQMSDLISRQAAIDALEEQLDYLQMLNKDENPKKESKWYGVNWARNTIDDLPSEQPEQRWIPCSDRLPDNANKPGDFCPKYQVMTTWGVTEGWFNPDHNGGMWDILVWFFIGRYDDSSDINFKRGDKPKMLWVPKEMVKAWRPLPDPYKDEDDGK